MADLSNYDGNLYFDKRLEKNGIRKRNEYI